MDLGNIVYIVAVLAYFIYQATRKKKGQDMADPDGESPEAPQKGMTFEDLMKEIREAQNPKPIEKPEPVRQKPVVQEAVKPEPYRTQSVPTHIPQPKPVSRRPVVVEEDDEETRYYEGSYAATKKIPYQNFKETSSADLIPSIKMDYDSINPKKSNPYAQLLKNPRSLKDAMVVSEILKPKHF